METWERVAASLEAPEPRIRDALYLASTGTLLDEIRAVDPGVQVLLVVGHNPDLSTLAAALAHAPTPGFQPGEGVVLRTEAPSWVHGVNGTLDLVARVP
jgi:phosphohistidine phosphatase